MRSFRKNRRAFVALSLALSLPFSLALLGCKKPSSDHAITIAAATSLRKALPLLVDGFVAAHPGKHATATYGSSGEVVRQIEGGADVDLVIVAAKDPMDRLVRGGHVDAASVKIVATNELVLIGPKKGPKLTFETLRDLPPGERLAIGDPASVPAGAYAKQALVALGVWKSLEDRLVLGGNVAAVLTYATRGEVAAAIVYRTEIEGTTGVELLDVAKGQWAPVPEVWAGVTTNGPARADAAQLLDFMVSAEGRRTLGLSGFGPPP